jgi:GAF domain-containing protein
MTHEPHRKKELEAALLEVLDEAMSVDQAACGKIRVYNAQARTLEIHAQRGFSDGFVQTFRAVDADEELACARAFRLRRRVAVPNVSTDPHSAPFLEPARAEGFKALQSTPLIAPGGRVVGTLSTHFARVHMPSASAALVLDYLSSKAATLIESFDGA